MTYIRCDGARFRERTEGFRRTAVRLLVNGEILFFDSEQQAQEFVYLCLDSGELRAQLFVGSRRVMTLEQGRFLEATR